VNIKFVTVSFHFQVLERSIYGFLTPYKASLEIFKPDIYGYLGTSYRALTYVGIVFTGTLSLFVIY